MNLIEILSYGFIQRALLAGVLIALLCAVLGVFLVLRRLSLIGDGLAHVTFGGTAVALMFKLHGVAALAVSLPVVLLASLGILRLTEKSRINGDAAIGIVSACGIAAGVILASLGGGYNVDLLGYLFGNILAISRTELLVAAIFSGVVIILEGLFYHDLVAVTFDEELARISGIATRRINMVLVLLTALAVVLAMKLAGIMLISALLILPAVSALQLARSFKACLLLAALAGCGSVVAGIFISFAVNLPASATIVLINLATFGAACAVRRLRSAPSP